MPCGGLGISPCQGLAVLPLLYDCQQGTLCLLLFVSVVHGSATTSNCVCREGNYLKPSAPLNISRCPQEPICCSNEQLFFSGAQLNHSLLVGYVAFTASVENLTFSRVLSGFLLSAVSLISRTSNFLVQLAGFSHIPTGSVFCVLLAFPFNRPNNHTVTSNSNVPRGRHISNKSHQLPSLSEHPTWSKCFGRFFGVSCRHTLCLIVSPLPCPLLSRLRVTRSRLAV
jgi:hypothetical protein